MEFNENQPIYIQIIDDIKTKLVNGQYSLGQEIPSRREMAKILKVNPNTVQRAYKEMEDMNLIKTLRGQGSFITEDSVVLKKLKEEMLEELIQNFVHQIQSLGLTKEEILSSIEKYL